MTADFDALFDFAGAAPPASSHRRPCILLVSHEASRTGAPFALLHLADALRKLDRFDVRIVTRFGGPLLDDFARVAPLCVAAEHWSRLGISHADFAAIVAANFARVEPRGLALCNTVALPEYNEAFMRTGIDVVTWIHELPAFFDASTMQLIVRASKHIGVYSEWNRAHFTGPYEIPADKLVFIPPTLRYLAAATTTAEQRRAARQAVGIAEDALMVLGVGNLHLVKGIDLFVQIAARCRRMLSPADERRLMFCWIGGDSDPMTRRVILSDLAALGLSGAVLLPGLQADPWPWYRAADVLACTSRWEAMGLSVLEGMSAGLPVVTFARTGASRFVADGAGSVVPLLDIEQFSAGVAAYLNAPILRAQAGETGHHRMRREFGDGKLPPGLMSVIDKLSVHQPSAELA